MLGLGLGINGGRAALLSSITDLFNGFNRITGDSYAGGPTVVPDNLGVLVSAGVNRMGIEGGRLSYDLAEGATLGAELVTAQADREFSSDTGWWTKVGAASISGGQANLPSISDGLQRLSVMVVRCKYQYSIEVTAVTGVVRVNIGGGIVDCTSTGVKTGEIFAASNTNILIIPSGGGSSGSIDNISVKEIIPVWLPTAANGSQLWTSQQIKTRRGTIAKYDSTFKGFLNEPARTNIALQSNGFNTTPWAVDGSPTPTQNVTGPFGVANSAWTLNDNSAVATEDVYAANNMAASTQYTYSAYFKRTVGALTAYSALEMLETSGSKRVTVLVDTTEGTAFIATAYTGYTMLPTTVVVDLSVAGWMRVSMTFSTTAVVGSRYIAVTPALTNIFTGDATPVVTCQGSVVIEGVQLEAGAFATSYIPTTTATVTRPATNYTRPTATVLPVNNFGIWGRVVPSASSAVQTIKTLFSSYADASNSISLDTDSGGGGIAFKKRVAGVLTTTFWTGVIAASTPSEYQFYQSSALGTGIRFKADGAGWSAWVTINTASSKESLNNASIYQVGALNNGSHFTGNFPFTAIIQHVNPKLELERLGALYP